MTDDVPFAVRRLGLIANPFDAADDTSADPIGVKLSKRSASNSLLTALARSADDPERRALVVEKSADVPTMYHVASLSPVLGALAKGDLGDTLQLYVPLDMMRIGRVRAVLHVLAERIAGSSADRTIATWLATIIESPTTALPEWAALAEQLDPDELRARFDSDPIAFVAEVLGEPVESREGADDLEVLMRVSHARQDRLGTDPDEAGGASDEVDEADPMGAAFVTPLGEVSDRVLEPAGDDTTEAIVAWLLAEARALSPVLARGLSAYRAQGTNSMAEELKVTKAPSKTLVALMRLARTRYQAAFVLFDRFDLFDVAPETLRADITTALVQMRAALEGLATVVLLMEPGIAADVDKAFADARRISWDFAELGEVSSMEAAFDPAVALRWLDAASLDGMPRWADAVVSAIPADVSAERGFAVLGSVIGDAALRGQDPTPAEVCDALNAIGD